jgi:hypothetical protein
LKRKICFLIVLYFLFSRPYYLNVKWSEVDCLHSFVCHRNGSRQITPNCNCSESNISQNKSGWVDTEVVFKIWSYQVAKVRICKLNCSEITNSILQDSIFSSQIKYNIMLRHLHSQLLSLSSKAIQCLIIGKVSQSQEEI